jgi:hypothetical protein
MNLTIIHAGYIPEIENHTSQRKREKGEERKGNYKNQLLKDKLVD